jgi:spore coat polysaccharide biosynthesis protein SpsF
VSPVVVIIQARFNSSRLRGKVLMDLRGRTVLARVIERVARTRGLDAMVVATTTRDDDDATAAEAARLGASVFRGAEHDPLGRYAGAALQSRAGTVVRVTADCPLFDPDVLSDMLVRWNDSRRDRPSPDYFSNCRPRTFPRGLDAEIFTAAALRHADAHATSPYDREHVTPYIIESGRFRLDNHTAPADHSHHRWTLDTAEDWAFVDAVYGELGGAAHFTTADVLALLERRPDLVALNAHVPQHPSAFGYQRSAKKPDSR